MVSIFRKIFPKKKEPTPTPTPTPSPTPSGGGQSVGGGAYKGVPYDSGTGKVIVRSGGGGSSGSSGSSSSGGGGSSSSGGGQSVGGGAYKGTPYDSGTGKTIVSSSGGSSGKTGLDFIREGRQPTQVKKNERQPSVVSVTPTEFERVGWIGSNVERPAPDFNLDYFKGKIVAPIFFAGAQGETILTSFKNIGSLFGGGKKGDEEFYRQAPTFGSISDQPLPFGAGGGGTITTEFDIKRGEALADLTLLTPPEVIVSRGSGRISREESGRLQGLIDTGQLTVPEAEKEFDIITQRRFDEEVIPSARRSAKFSSDIGLLEKRKDFGTAAELGLTAAAFTNPVTGAIVSAAFVAEGLPKITGGDTWLERGFGVGEVGLGLVGGGFAVRGVERAADRLLIQELQAETGTGLQTELARVKGGDLFFKEGEFNIKLTGSQARRKISKDFPELIGADDASLFLEKTGSGFGTQAQISSELRLPIFRTVKPKVSTRTELGQEIILEPEKEIVSLVGGKGTSKINFFSVEKGKFVSSTEQFSFNAPNIKQTDLLPKLIDTKAGGFVQVEETKGFLGNVFVQPKGGESFIIKGFGGTSKQIEKDLFEFRGGSIIGERIKRKAITKKDQIFIIEDRPTSLIRVEEKGFLQRLPQMDSFDDSVKVFQGGGKKTPFSKTFQMQQLDTALQPPVGLGSQIQKQFFKPSQLVSSPTGKLKLMGIQRAVGGEGLLDFQLPKQSPQISLQSQQPTFVVAPIRNSLQGGGNQFMNLGFGASSLGGLLPKQISPVRTSQPQIPIFKQPTGQLQGQLFERTPLIPFTTTPRTPPFFGEGGRIPFFALPPFPIGAPTRIKKRKGAKRKLKRTPSFAAAYKQFELGIKMPKFSEALERTGLFERAVI